MLGGASTKMLFSLKIVVGNVHKKLLWLNILDGADMKKLFSLKMLDGVGVNKLFKLNIWGGVWHEKAIFVENASQGMHIRSSFSSLCLGVIEWKSSFHWMLFTPNFYKKISFNSLC